MEQKENLAPWEEIAISKRELRDKALAKYLAEDLDSRPERVDNVAERSRISPQSAQDITDIDSIELLKQRIAEGKLTAEDVTLAYIKRLVRSLSDISL